MNNLQNRVQRLEGPKRYSNIGEVSNLLDWNEKDWPDDFILDPGISLFLDRMENEGAEHEAITQAID